MIQWHALVRAERYSPRPRLANPGTMRHLAERVVPPEALIDGRQTFLCEPSDRLFTARVVVVAGHVPLDDLAPHCGQPAGGQALERLLDLPGVHFLYCQIDKATRVLAALPSAARCSRNEPISGRNTPASSGFRRRGRGCGTVIVFLSSCDSAEAHAYAPERSRRSEKLRRGTSGAMALTLFLRLAQVRGLADATKSSGQGRGRTADLPLFNHAQARRLLSAVRQQIPSGPRLVAFFAIIYYAALRPEEAVSLRKDNITLPPLVRNDATGKWEEPADNWGELRFCSAATEIGAEWTDDDTRREHRSLKSRAVGEWRRVPIAPPLTRILRSHLDEFGAGPDGRVFSGIHRGELASITYRRVWGKARCSALAPAEYASPLARRVYDLRHACVSTWLNGGVPPAQVAEWAGHSVAVLLKVYAKCIDGQDQIAKRRIEDALRETGDAEVIDHGAAEDSGTSHSNLIKSR